jgi:pumilio RNA-binding family
VQDFADLMMDNYANYFCQRLLQTCTPLQRFEILQAIERKFISICCNKKGTHTIQSMFDTINMPEEFTLIISTLRGNIVKLSKDPQGNHVVQKVLSIFEPEMREFIFDEVAD